MGYKYYQPNKKDIKDEYGDCVIRALSKVLDKTWKETFELVLPFCIEEQCPIDAMPLRLYKKLFESLGFKYYGISNKKGTTRPTVKSFSQSHKQGKYILSVASHMVASENGDWFDTWNSENKCLYGYYEKVLTNV